MFDRHTVNLLIFGLSHRWPLSCIHVPHSAKSNDLTFSLFHLCCKFSKMIVHWIGIFSPTPTSLLPIMICAVLQRVVGVCVCVCACANKTNDEIDFDCVAHTARITTMNMMINRKPKWEYAKYKKKSRQSNSMCRIWRRGKMRLLFRWHNLNLEQNHYANTYSWALGIGLNLILTPVINWKSQSHWESRVSDEMCKLILEWKSRPRATTITTNQYNRDANRKSIYFVYIFFLNADYSAVVRCSPFLSISPSNSVFPFVRLNFNYTTCFFEH